MYHVDSGPSTVTAYPYDVDAGVIAGEPSGRFTVEGGGADGMTIDIDGCLWIAVHGAGEVRRYSPAGECSGVRSTSPDAGTTSCIFGGAGLDELYVTTSCYGVRGRWRRPQWKRVRVQSRAPPAFPKPAFIG